MPASILPYAAIAIVIVVLVVVVVHALWAFTRHIGGKMEDGTGRDKTKEEKEAAAKRVRTIVQYAYASIVVLIGAAVLPFVWPEFPDPFPGPNAPIHILKACPDDAVKEANNNEQLKCPRGTLQWSVNIGGAVSTKAATIADANQEKAKRRIQAVFVQAGIKLQDAIQEVNALPESQRNSIAEAAVKEIQSIRSTLGSTITVRDPVISGGLVVPLYMIVIALIGGCIGMTRRVPEYQRRGAPGYESYYEQNEHRTPKPKRPLDGLQVREHIVFQIMQAVFAPFLAVVAFAMIDPTDVAGVVAIGFVSGFASEPVLMQIRKVAEATTSLSTGSQAPSGPATDTTPTRNPKARA